MNDLLQSILARCTEVGDCLEWRGAMMNGTQPGISLPKVLPDMPYRRRKTMSAAVLVYEASRGTNVAEGRVVWRTCCNHRCLEPSHLRAGTQEQLNRHNMRAGLLRKSPQAIAAITASARRRSTTKLTAADVEQIRLLRGEVSADELGARFGVRGDYVLKLWSGRNWRPSVSASSVFAWRPA